MSNLRKGMVMGTKDNTMAFDYDDGGSDIPVSRWMFGGTNTGLHVGASQFDQGVVLRWGDRLMPIAAVPMTDHPEQLPKLGPGEVLLYGPGGSPLLSATATAPLVLGANGCTVAVDAGGDITISNSHGSVKVFANGNLALAGQAGASIATNASGDTTITSAGGTIVMANNGTISLTSTAFGSIVINNTGLLITSIGTDITLTPASGHSVNVNPSGGGSLKVNGTTVTVP